MEALDDKAAHIDLTGPTVVTAALPTVYTTRGVPINRATMDLHHALLGTNDLD